jgi:pimeloyl-ACP methyl ester carboxylesterase
MLPDLTMSAELRHLTIDDLTIGYRRSGKGPALVLLHGFLCDSRCWRHQLEDLSAQFDVIAWDAPGAGSSSDPPHAFTLGDWSRCLAQFLDTLGVTQAHLVGLSWGGVLAQEYYRRYPGRVLRLVLAGTYAGWRGSLPAFGVEQRLARCERESHLPAAEFVPRWVPEMFTSTVSQDVLDELSAVFADFHPRGFRLMAKSLADTDTTDLLPRIAAPILLLWGENDERSPISIAEQLRRSVPGAELRVIAHAGHVSNMEQPAAFNHEVRDFCLG